MEKYENYYLTENKKEKLINYLLEQQNSDGSWKEVHSNYNYESSLITSIVASSLLTLDNYKDYEAEIKMAYRYIKSQEFHKGYFKKSDINYSDCLNVNATCGSFFSLYYSKYNQKEQRISH